MIHLKTFLRYKVSRERAGYVVKQVFLGLSRLGYVAR